MKHHAQQFEMPGAGEVFNLASEAGTDFAARQNRAAKLDRDRQEAARRQVQFSFDAGKESAVNIRFSR